MSYRVTLLPDARQELATIFTWLANRSPQGAKTWFNRFTEALLTLEDAPLSFGLAPESEFANREVRQLIFKTKRGRRYRALFTVSGDTVHVLHIRGPGQDLVEPHDV
jgi:plasmid stabilization system protein ParE